MEELSPRCYIAYDPQEDTETPGMPDLLLVGPGVTSPTIRKRILKRACEARACRAVSVTSPTIRKRILKQAGGPGAVIKEASYIAYDPQEDTETRPSPAPPPRSCPLVTSPTIRKRILKHTSGRSPTAASDGYIAYDPQEDTETFRKRTIRRRLVVTSPTIRKRILKLPPSLV